MKVGKFDVDVMVGGYPVWITITHNGKYFKFTHSEISDLEYAVARAKKEAINSLPDRHKGEV